MFSPIESLAERFGCGLIFDQTLEYLHEELPCLKVGYSLGGVIEDVLFCVFLLVDHIEEFLFLGADQVSELFDVQLAISVRIESLD